MGIAAIILTGLLALAFTGSGLSKIAGAQMQVENFRKLGLPSWFRVVTGLLQLVGAAALVVGFWHSSWAAWGGIWFGFMMLVAVGVHVRAKDSFSHAMPALVLALLGIVLAILLGSELGNFPN